jgi:hypothetical protein
MTFYVLHDLPDDAHLEGPARHPPVQTMPV